MIGVGVGVGVEVGSILLRSSSLGWYLPPARNDFIMGWLTMVSKKIMLKTMIPTRTVRLIVSGVQSFWGMGGVGTVASGTEESIEFFFILI